MAGWTTSNGKLTSGHGEHDLTIQEMKIDGPKVIRYSILQLMTALDCSVIRREGGQVLLFAPPEALV